MKKTALALLLTIITTPTMAETIHVGVDGMVCAFCIKGIEDSFKKHAVISDVNVDLDNKLVTLTTNEGTTLDDDTIRAAITADGFATTTIHHTK